MARPDFTARRKGASNSPKSANPFVNWLQRRKELRTETEEKASRMITNKIAENESAIVDQLKSIDFINCKMPKNVLEKKTDKNQPCGDLEYARNVAINLLLKNPQIIKMDIRPIDRKLMTLVLLFKQSVEQGDVRAAYAAKGGLIRGLNDIRCRIPQNQPELAKQFVETNTQYMEQWVTLVGLAQVADRMKQNLERERERHNASVEQQKKSTEKLFADINANSELMVAWGEINAHDLPEERSQWTETQRKVHTMMIDDRMKTVNLKLTANMVTQHELDLKVKVGQVEFLYTKVASLPIVCDPDLLNKFQEQVNSLFEELAKSDAELDETIKTMDDIEGRIKQMDEASGAIRARETAFEQAQEVQKRIDALQDVASGNVNARAREMRERMGIKTPEQLEELKKQAEEAEQRALEEAKLRALEEAKAKQNQAQDQGQSQDQGQDEVIPN